MRSEIGEGIEKISKSTNYRGLPVSTGFQYILTFTHQKIQLNSQIQIAHVKCAHAYRSVISIKYLSEQQSAHLPPKMKANPLQETRTLSKTSLHPQSEATEGT